MEAYMERSTALEGRIKLRDLHVLQAAAQTGSMAKAAAHLAITQPAVSYAISELEHAVGVPLLDRTSQGVTPTVYGRALLERSAIVFNELRHGINEIASLADPGVGELRIGTTPPMSAVASAVFNRLVPRYPRMRFELSVGGTDLLLRQLRQRDVEIVISRLASMAGNDDLSVETLFHDELVTGGDLQQAEQVGPAAQRGPGRPRRRTLGISARNRLPHRRHARRIRSARPEIPASDRYDFVYLCLERSRRQRQFPRHPPLHHADDAE
jgi:DNA-binding transcriptional LysR family regulator